MSSSAGNHVTGSENGAETGWWTYTVGEGGGTSSSTSGGGPWSDSYDETVNDPGFYEGAYYGWDYGGGREEYFAYLGDAFYENPGSDSAFFPFAYSGGEVLFGAARDFNATLLRLNGFGSDCISAKESTLQAVARRQRVTSDSQAQSERVAKVMDGEDSPWYLADSPVAKANLDSTAGDEWDNPDWRLGPWGSFFGTVCAGIAGIGRVLTYPGRLIPGTSDFWERRDRALQRLYDASNIGGTGWQTLSEYGSEAGALAITWGLTTPSLGGAVASGLTGEQALTRLAAALRFTETTARRMADPTRYVPRHILAGAILYGERMPDPQGATGAVKIVCAIYRNGKRYILEIIYRESDNTILHFLYK